MGRKKMTTERLKEIETLQVERINIERTHFEAAEKIRDSVLKFNKDEKEAQAAMGILFHITINALLNGYADTTPEKIIEEYHCDELTATLIDLSYQNFKSGIFNTRNSLISGSTRKETPAVSLPTDLPEGLGG